MAGDTDDWREKLRLGRDAQAIADKEIDPEVLSRLREQDLEQIGPQLIGRAFDEEEVFKVAEVLEQAAGFEALPQFIAEAL